MDATVQKWGNSLALRIPKAFVESTNLSRGSVVNIDLRDGKIVVEPKTRSKYSLKELVKGITEENRHGEVHTGTPKGNEVW